MKIHHILLALIFAVPRFLLAEVSLPPEFDTPNKKLLFAVVHNDVELARQALSSGAELEAEFVGSGANTPLQVCAILGNREVAEVLLEKGASVTWVEDFSHNAVGLAAENNQIEMLKFLVTYADLLGPIRASLYENTFSKALQEGHLEIVKLLVQVGIDPKSGFYRHARNPVRDKRDYRGIDALNIAAKHGNPAVIRFLLDECGLDANQKIRGYSNYPLWTAVSLGNFEAARLLIEKGADVNATAFGNPSKLSCLSVAVRLAHLDCVDLLLKNGARPVSLNPKMNPKLEADLAGFDAYVDRFTEMGVELELWDIWQKDFQSQQASVEKNEPAPVGGLAAHLIEGDWDVSPSDTPSNTDDLHRVAILGDAESLEFSDLLLAQMSGMDGAEFVERNELESIIREHQLDRAGLLKYQRLQDFSKLIGADSIVLVSKIVLDKNEVYRLQCLDVKHGLVLNVRYASAEKKVWSEFSTRYADFFTQSLLTQDAGKRIPVSLMGVSANWATPEGRRLEKDLFYVIQHALSKQSGLLLLDRQSLKQLVSEKRLGGKEESSFQASGLFINVRVDVDISSGAVQKLVLNAVKSEESISEDLSFEEPAGESTLTEDSMKIVGRFVDALTNNGDSEKPAQPLSSSIEADQKAMLDEAYWLYRTGMYVEAQGAIENAMALGLKSPGAWKLYLRILEDSIPELWHETKSNDANNQKIIELEHDRLWALENYLKTSKEGKRDQLEKQISLFKRTLLEGFSHSLLRMRSVTMKRRYRDELIELENHFIRLFDQTIKPLGKQQSNDSLSRQLLKAAFWTLPNLNFISQSERERLVRESVSGQDAYLTLDRMYPRSVKGGLEQWHEWVRKYGTPYFVSAFYRDVGDYIMSRISRRRVVRHTISRYNEEIYQAELFSYLEKLESPDAELELAKLRTITSPESISCRVSNKDDVYAMTLAGQKLHAAEYLLKLKDKAGRYFANRKSSLSKYSSVSLLREMQAVELQWFKLMSEASSPDKRAIKAKQKTLNFINKRIQELSTTSNESEAELPFVNAYLWDMKSADLQKNKRFNFWYGSLPDTRLFQADGALWAIGKYWERGNKVWIFRMDEKSRETSFQTFTIPEGVDALNSNKSFIFFFEKKIIFGGSDSSSTIVLDRKSGTVTEVSDFIPFKISGGSEYPAAHIHNGDLYYTAVPRYMKLSSIQRTAAKSCLVVLKLDLDTMQHTVIANFRRKPAETPLDHPLDDLTWRIGFDLYYNKNKGNFLFFHNYNKYEYEPETGKFTKLSDKEYNAKLKKVVKTYDGWKPDPTKNEVWVKPRSSRASGRRVEGDVAFTLYNYKKKELKAISLKLKPLAGESPSMISEVEKGIEKLEYRLNMSSEKYSALFFQDPARFVIIENSQLSEAIKKAAPIKE